MFPMLAIRPCRPTDAARVAAIYAEHVLHGTATFDTEPPDIAAMESKIIEFIERGWPFLVAEEAGEVIGYAYSAQFRDRPAYAHACEDSVYIDSAHHGRGVGRALMVALIEASEAAGFRQMIAVIGGGEAASVALHTGQGFEAAGRMRSVGRKFGRWLDTVYMQRALGDGDTNNPD